MSVFLSMEKYLENMSFSFFSEMLNNLPADDPYRTPFYVTVQGTKHVDILTFQH